jgi:hypothetical protein
MMKISGSLDITSLALVTLLINTGVVFTQISAVNQRTNSTVKGDDHEGNELWTRQFGTPQEDLASGIGVDSSGVYVAGITAGALPDQTSLGGSDAFVIKLAKE